MRGIIAFAFLACSAAVPAGGPVAAQQGPPEATTPDSITVSYQGTAMADVLRTFAEHSGRSIVASGVEGIRVTAEIRSQPWDVALRAILEAHGLVATETESGILRVGPDVPPAAAAPTLVTRIFHINYARADEIAAAVAPHLTSEWGRVSVVPSINAIVITDVPEVVNSTAGMIH